MKNLKIFLFISTTTIISVTLAFENSPRYSSYISNPTDKTADWESQIQPGDIIFQTSLSEQSKAIQLATKSTYSHCGIIFKENNSYVVLEAVQPIKTTALKKWIERGADKHFVIKRLKNFNKILNPETLATMQNIGSKFKGKNYDLLFEWSDDRIYCSELVWKIYKQGANIELGKLQKLKDFNLEDKMVKQKLKERYGSKIPMEEPVISPAKIFESNLLTTFISK